MTDALYEQILKNTKAYCKKHPPNTGYTIRAMEAVCGAARENTLDTNANILVQFALLFDGKKTIEQLLTFSNEKRLPYRDSRSLDKSSDCSSWVQNLFDLFFGIDIGTWTEAQWKKLKSKKVAFKDLRQCDLIFWNFKSGRTVSHVALYIGNGKIIHTTSEGNPMRVENATYSSSKRVGCARVLTDAQYTSLIVTSGGEQEKGDDIQLKKGEISAAVGNMQRALKMLGYNLGTFGPEKDGIDDEFGSVTEAAVKMFQMDKCLTVNGVVETITATAMMAALTVKAKESEKVQGLEEKVNSLTAKIEAAKKNLA